MSVERAETILRETIYSPRLIHYENCQQSGISDSLIYRLTFDPEEEEDVDDTNQLITSDYHLRPDPSKRLDNFDDNGNLVESDFPTYKSTASIVLNVSSLADEIIDAEMDSLKGLGQTNRPLSESTTTRTTSRESTVRFDDDKCSNRNDGLTWTSVIIDKTNDDHCDGDGRMKIGHLDGDESDHVNRRRRRLIEKKRPLRLLLIPSMILRQTINTEASIINYNCPPTRACLSCCTIS